MGREYGRVRAAFWDNEDLKPCAAATKMVALYLLTARREKHFHTIKGVAAGAGIDLCHVYDACEVLERLGFISVGQNDEAIFFDRLLELGTPASAQQSNNLRPALSIWKKLRDFVFGRDNHTCVYCGATDRQLHCDHVIPVSRGGSSDPSNLVTACAPCNMAKRAKTPEEWRADQ